MKCILPSMVLLASVLMVSGCSQSQNDDPVLESPYLGQTPPGLIPKSFVPSEPSSEHRDSGVFFTPDMKEIYFKRRRFADGKWFLIVLKHANEQWQESVVGPRVGRPKFSADGKTMHLGDQYMERTDTGWSEIKSLGPLFEGFQIMTLVSSLNGTYYFDEGPKTGPLFYSRLIDGKHEHPKAVNIDFGDWTAHPYVAPDESYLMWDMEREDGYGETDLYISFRLEDGSWGAAVNMGDTINTSAYESGAYVTPDGKYFFFDRYVNEENAGIYWVDSAIIENLRPKP